MANQNINWMAEQGFTCRAPDGKLFPLIVRLSFPEKDEGYSTEHHPVHRCRVGLEPLARDHWAGGQNAFQALCLALDLIRRVFKIYMGEGGRVYFDDDTESLIDLDSPWFGPIADVSKIGLKLNSPVD